MLFACNRDENTETSRRQKVSGKTQRFVEWLETSDDYPRSIYDWQFFDDAGMDEYGRILSIPFFTQAQQEETKQEETEE